MKAIQLIAGVGRSVDVQSAVSQGCIPLGGPMGKEAQILAASRRLKIGATADWESALRGLSATTLVLLLVDLSLLSGVAYALTPPLSIEVTNSTTHVIGYRAFNPATGLYLANTDNAGTETISGVINNAGLLAYQKSSGAGHQAVCLAIAMPPNAWEVRTQPPYSLQNVQSILNEQNRDGAVVWQERYEYNGGFVADYIWLATFHPLLGWKVKGHTASQFYKCSGLTTANGAVAWLDASDAGTGSSYFTMYFAIYDPALADWQIGAWYLGYRQNGTVSNPTISNATVYWTAGGVNYKRGYIMNNGWYIDTDTWTKAYFVATPNRGSSPLVVWCIDISVAANSIKYDFRDGSPLVTARTTYHSFTGNCNTFVPVQFAYDIGGNYNSYGYSVYMDGTSPTGSIVINNNAPTTPSSSVTLTLPAQDNCGVSQMSFRNESGTWSALETYAATKNWTLAPGEGTRTVSVYFRDSAGNASPIYSDNIVVNYPLTVQDVVDVSPDPRSNLVSSVDFVLSEAASSFGSRAVSLTRGGSPVALSGLSFSQVSGTTYRVSGLGPFTATPGTYVLTVSGSGIVDAGGFAGSGTASDSWVVCLPESGVVYVDRSYKLGGANGSVCLPFPTVTEGYQAGQNGNTIHITSGNYNEVVIMSKVLTLVGTNGVVNIGKP